MRFVLNAIWFVLAGFWLALAYAFAGLLLLCAIITAPLSLAAFKLSLYSLFPFGQTVVQRPDTEISVLGNVVWVVLFGWWLALLHVITAIALAITIIGLPLAAADFKLARVALWPFSRELVPREMGDRTSGELIVHP